MLCIETSPARAGPDEFYTANELPYLFGIQASNRKYTHNMLKVRARLI